MIPYAGRRAARRMAEEPKSHDHVDEPRPASTISRSSSPTSTAPARRAPTGCSCRPIFRMGIPVSGKNVFPSNIQGLPTWYEIRVSKDGYTARAPDVDLDGRDERADVRAGTSPRCAPAATSSTTRRGRSTPRSRATDITILGVPLARLCNETLRRRARAHPDEEHRLRRRARGAARHRHGRRRRAARARRSRARSGAARREPRRPSSSATTTRNEHFDCPLPFRLETMDATGGHILIDGNTAAALGCVYAGATVGAWYPITPSTSVMDAFKAFCERYRKDPRPARSNYCIVQAEDELAAIGMVLGASLERRARVHADGGPGISLMNEFSASRTTPRCRRSSSTCSAPGRRPACRRARSRATSCRARTRRTATRKHILLFPANPASASTSRSKAFDLAERFQTPGVRAVRSRHRHERLDVPATSSGTTPTGPTAARCSSAEELEKLDEVPPLRRRRRRRHRVLARCPACIRRARTSRAARATTSSAPTPRTRPSTRSRRPAGAQVRTAAQLVPGAGRSTRRKRGASRASSRSAAATARSARRSTCSTTQRHPVDYMRVRALPVRRDGRASSSPQHELLLRRRAEPRRAAQERCSRSRPACASAACARCCTTAGCRIDAPTASSTGAATQARRRERRSRMTSIAKAEDRPPEPRATNALGLTRRDYEGAHVDAVRRLRPRLDHRGDRRRRSGSSTFAPQRVAKLSGHRLLVEDAPPISSSGAHGFNSVHGRMPSIATGANAANRELIYIGVSGDGDSLSIGLGQFMPRDPPQPRHGLHHREQRRVRAHEGPVLRLRRRRLESEEGRGQQAAADRSGAARR